MSFIELAILFQSLRKLWIFFDFLRIVIMLFIVKNLFIMLLKTLSNTSSFDVFNSFSDSSKIVSLFFSEKWNRFLKFENRSTFRWREFVDCHALFFWNFQNWNAFYCLFHFFKYDFARSRTSSQRFHVRFVKNWYNWIVFENSFNIFWVEFFDLKFLTIS